MNVALGFLIAIVALIGSPGSPATTPPGASADSLYQQCVSVAIEPHVTTSVPREPRKSHKLRKLAACDAFYRELTGSEPETFTEAPAANEPVDPLMGLDAAQRTQIVYSACRSAALGSRVHLGGREHHETPHERMFLDICDAFRQALRTRYGMRNGN